MGQVHHTFVSLEDLTGSSTHVLVVGAANPPSRRVMYEPTRIDPASGEPYTFEFQLRRLRVEEVLAGANVEIGEVIEVEPAEIENEYDLNFRYDVIGIDESPDYLSYKPLVEPVDPRWIVFLTRGRARFRYTMIGAAEGVESLEDVRGALAAAPPFADSVVPVEWDD